MRLLLLAALFATQLVMSVGCAQSSDPVVQVDDNRDTVVKIEDENDAVVQKGDEAEPVPSKPTTPVEEVDSMPESAKELLGYKHSDRDHHLRLTSNTYGIYDREMFGWASVGWWSGVFDEQNSQYCYDVALSNLLVGRFDTAIEVLEKRLAATPASDSLKPQMTKLLEEARLVKSTLTAARDSLREQQPDLEYPDESIFMAARMSSPNEFLALNLADAYLAAFPESKSALRRAGELSLTIAEADDANPNRTTNVPKLRRDCAEFWGETILSHLRKLAPQDSYPVIRLMSHELNRPQPRGLDRDAFQGIWDNFDSRTDFTKQEKGFLEYGRAMILLKSENGWGVPIADKIVKTLDEAAKWDPEVKQYALLRDHVRANEDSINQIMLAKREQDLEESEALNALLRKGQQKNARDEFEVAFFGMLGRLAALEREATKEDNPQREKLVENCPCPICFGTKRDWVFGKACHYCNQTGRYPKLNRSARP